MKCDAIDWLIKVLRPTRHRIAHLETRVTQGKVTQSCNTTKPLFVPLDVSPLVGT